MIYCEIKDCSESNNKCINCRYKDCCDFVWVSNIWKKNSELLTPLMPGWVKPEFRNNHIITITRKYDFCIFNVPKKSDTITIQDICVDSECRGKGISKQILETLMNTYDRDIIAKCVKGTSADSFWSHIGEKIGEEPGKKRILCVYKVYNTNKKIRKTELF